MALGPDDYFTDGQRKRLYRLVMYLPEAEGVLLEDVGTGKTITRSPGEFSELKPQKIEPLQKGVASVG